MWGISKSPKHFDWVIESIAIRPSLSLFSRSCSEVIVSGWTWRNPAGFPQSEPLLHVRRMTLELDLWSIPEAIRNRTAIRVHQIHLDGVDFNARRDHATGATNLWVALDLPDQDVNAVVRKLGNLHARATLPGGGPEADVVEPLANPPPAPPRAPRNKTYFSSSTMCCGGGGSADANLLSQSESLGSRTESSRDERRADSCKKKDASSVAAPPPPLRREETMIGDPKRRPRWGVPVLFEVERTVATKINVDVMDLVVARKHTGSRSMSVNHVSFSREVLTRGEAKRQRGVYLGELVWMLIHVLVQKIVRSKPTRLVATSTLAAAFAASDLAHYTVAKTLEMAINTRTDVSRLLIDRGRSPSSPDEPASTVKVELVKARHLYVHRGDRGTISCRAVVMLRRSSSSHPESRFDVVDRRSSDVRMWTRNPSWKHSVELGPIDSLKRAQLVVVCVHHGNVVASGGVVAVGEVVIPLVSVFTRATLASTRRRNGRKKKMDVVAWFRLSTPTEASSLVVDEGSPQTTTTTHAASSSFADEDGKVDDAVDLLVGEIKLGLKLTSPHSCAEFAHLETLRQKTRSPRS